MKEYLQQLGLTRNEAVCYLKLIGLSASTASILSQKTHINRALIYRILESLEDRGLVSSIVENGVTIYKTNSLTNLKSVFDEKLKLIDKVENELKQVKKDDYSSFGVETYKDIKGLKALLTKQIESGFDFEVLGAGNDFSELSNFFYDQYYVKRIERKIKQKILLRTGAKNKKKFIENSKYSLVRILPREYVQPLTTIIFGKYVTFISWSEKQAILIHSEKMAQGFREQFKMLWDISK